MTRSEAIALLKDLTEEELRIVEQFIDKLLAEEAQCNI